MNSKCMHAAEMTARSWGGLEIAGSAGRSIQITGVEWQLPKKNSARIRRTRAKQPYDSNVLDSQWLNLASQTTTTRYKTHDTLSIPHVHPAAQLWPTSHHVLVPGRLLREYVRAGDVDGRIYAIYRHQRPQMLLRLEERVQMGHLAQRGVVIGWPRARGDVRDALQETHA